MVEKPWLAVFIVTCALGLAVVLDLFQLHVHSAILYFCTLPTETSPEGLQLRDFTFVQGGIDILELIENPLNYCVSYFKNWRFVWGLSPRDDRTGEQ